MKRLVLSLATVIAFVANMLIPSVAGAADSTSSSTVTGTVDIAITVTAPTNITLPPLIPGSTVNTEATTEDVQVATNLTNWTLTAIEGGGSPDGKMMNTTPDPDATLTHALKIAGGDLGTTYATLESPRFLESAGSGGATIEIDFEQQVASNDAAGTYTITVVFTGAGTS